MIKPSIFITTITIVFNFLIAQLPCNISFQLFNNTESYSNENLIDQDFTLYLDDEEISIKQGISKNAKGKIKIKFKKSGPKEAVITFGVLSNKDNSKRAITSFEYKNEDFIDNEINLNCDYLPKIYKRVEGWTDQYKEGNLIMVLEVQNKEPKSHFKVYEIPIY